MSVFNVRVLREDACLRLMLAGAMRGHRCATVGQTYVDVDGEILIAVRRVLVELDECSFVQPAICLASQEPHATSAAHAQAAVVRHPGDEWSLTPIEAQA